MTSPRRKTRNLTAASYHYWGLST